MILQGTWEGTYQFENLRGYMEDNSLILRVIDVDSEGKLRGEIIETTYKKGLRGLNQATGIRKIAVSGTFPAEGGKLKLTEAGGSHRLEIEFHPDSRTGTGYYYGDSDYGAKIQLKRIV